MQLKWTQDERLSALHAAWCLRFQRERTTETLKQLASTAIPLLEALSSLPRNAACTEQNVWELSLSLSPRIPSAVDFSRRLLHRLNGSLGGSDHASIPALATAITDWQSSYHASHAQLVSELKLRTAPLLEQWEAFGPGLLHQIERLVAPAGLVDAADVLLVLPEIGGYGMAHPTTNAVHMEAVLTNTDQRIPETVRLAWLLAQLDFDRPQYSENIGGYRQSSVIRQAVMLPALLAAAELGMGELNQEAILLAADLWRLGPEKTPRDEWAGLLLNWWETYLASGVAWPTALTGLDRMLLDLDSQ